MRDAGLVVTPARFGPYDIVRIHCWGCNRNVRWTAKNLPKHLPRDVPFNRMEKRLRCVKCHKRGEATLTFWRPDR